MLDNKNRPNIIEWTDSYKQTMYLQQPYGAEELFGYGASRKSSPEDYRKLMSGGNMILQDLLSTKVTMENIDESEVIHNLHFPPNIKFNREGWERIVKDWGGSLPMVVRSLPDGVQYKIGEVGYTIEVHKDFPWLHSHVEVMLLRAKWYATAIATLCYNMKSSIVAMLVKTSEMPIADCIATSEYMLHDFSPRGCMTGEQAAHGGVTHLQYFKGTDNKEGILWLFRRTGEVYGNSIPAREHTTVITYKNEVDAYYNSVDQFGEGMFAIVIDSTDSEATAEFLTTDERFTTTLKEKGGKCVLRPDSGDPTEEALMCLEKIYNNVGGYVNSKGYKVVDSQYGVILGDGLDAAKLSYVMEDITGAGWCISNMAFGMGGALLGDSKRDDEGWSMKASNITIDGEDTPISKSPKGSAFKKSKAGKLAVVGLETVTYEGDEIEDNELEIIYNYGKLNPCTMEDARDEVNTQLEWDYAMSNKGANNVWNGKQYL